MTSARTPDANARAAWPGSPGGGGLKILCVQIRFMNADARETASERLIRLAVEDIEREARWREELESARRRRAQEAEREREQNYEDYGL